MVYEEEVKSPASRLVEKLGKRNLIIAGVVLLVGVAVLLNFMVFSGDNAGGFGGYDEPSGLDQNLGSSAGEGDSTATDSKADSYFSTTQISRERARDEALEVLQSVVDKASSDEATKTQALADISQIARDMEAESNIETLIVAKGFEQCVAVISNGRINVVVKSEKLTPSDISIINEIVYDQANIKPANVNIVQK